MKGSGVTNIIWVEDMLLIASKAEVTCMMSAISKRFASKISEMLSFSCLY